MNRQKAILSFTSLLHRGRAVSVDTPKTLPQVILGVRQSMPGNLHCLRLSVWDLLAILPEWWLTGAMPIAAAQNVIPSHSKQKASRPTSESNRASSPPSCNVRTAVPSHQKGLDSKSDGVKTASLIKCETSDIDPSEHPSSNTPSVDPPGLGSGSCGIVLPVQENDAGAETHGLDCTVLSFDRTCLRLFADLNTRATPRLDRFSCKSCSEEPAQPTVTMCGHLFCRR